MQKSIIFFFLLTSVVPVYAREHVSPDPESLPLSTTLSLSETAEKPALPEQLELVGSLFTQKIQLSVLETTGEVKIASPTKETVLCSGNSEFLVWEKLSTGAKSSIVLKSNIGVEYRIGADAMVQFITGTDGDFKLRLFKGRVRIVNPEVEIIEVETLNAVAKISQGVADIIISAMNTLVAPREGSKIRVVSRKADRVIMVGDYGLIMADGSLVFTRGHKGGKS